MLKKDYSNIIILVLVFFLLFILVYPSFVISEVQTALFVFITKYFPAVFPIYIITDLLIYYHFPEKIARFFDALFQKTFHCSGMGAFVLFLSMISGFPSGAKYTKELLEKGIISDNMANYLITFTHFSNPLFILGTCFLITKNKTLTILIFISHFLANFMIAFIVRPKRKEESFLPYYSTNESFVSALSNSIFQTFRLMFLILGTSILFFVLSGVTIKIVPLHSYSYLITGLLEVTKGISHIPAGFSPFYQGIIILLFLSFGSLSIHMQVLSIIKDTNILYRHFLLGRVSQVGISILLFYLFSLFNLL